MLLKHPAIRILWIYILPIGIFCLGCLLHIYRGYYNVVLPTTQAQGADDAYIAFRYG